MESKQKQPGLYEPRFEHDNCGIGAVANIKGIRSHHTVDQALHIVENLEHRAGGKDAEGKTGRRRGYHAPDFPRIFKKVTEHLGFQIGRRERVWRGYVFFPRMN